MSATLVVLLVLTVFLSLAGPGPGGVVMPGVQRAVAQSAPGWMTPEQAARFVNDWPALVPSWVPEPFANVTPSISVSGGEYQLYWFVPGGSPTFLDVRGYVDGRIPAGSTYDLNVELIVNASVRGNPAYHDPTPIYDAVHWREGGISYWATAQGLSTDIVSYANGFAQATAPALEPTATVAASATLFSPDAIASGGLGTVTAGGGGSGATLVADGGVFADTGTATYPGAGDAAVTWVAPDVAVDTVVTFSLLDANGAVLVTTPTLVTAAAPPIGFALDCAPTVAAGDTLAIAISGSGNVMLAASDGFWPRSSPNTDYDPGTDGGTLAFSLGGGGEATLVWAAPMTPRFVTLTATGASGMTVARCEIEVLGVEPTMTATAVAGSTVPVVTATAPPVAIGTIGPPATTIPVSRTATADVPVPTPTSAAPVLTPTVPGTNPGDGTDTGFGPAPTAPVTNATVAVSGPASQPTVPGTSAGDGIDSGQGNVSPAPSSTARSGDGTDFGGVATVPPSSTYPAIPTSAPLPAAPPTSVPPIRVATQGAGQTIPSTSPAPIPAPATANAIRATPGVTATPARHTPTLPSPTATAAAATAGPPATSRAVAQVTATAVRPTATIPAATATATITVPTATARPTATMSAVAAPTPTATVPAAVAAAPTRGSTATATAVPPTATAPAPTATAPAPTATALPASPVPPTATVAPPTVTATLAPPAAAATRRPPATATPTPVRPGQRPELIAGSPVASAPTAPPAPTATLSPASPMALVPAATPTEPVAMETVQQEIGPTGGTVQHPAGGWLGIAEGTFGSMMTVSMAQVPDTELPVSPDVELIPSTGYEIEIRPAEGAAMTTLPAGVTLNLAVPDDQRSGAVVYWIDGERLTRLGASSTDEAGVSAPLAHLSRYVAGVPVTETPELGWLPWVVAIAAALSGLMVVGLLAQNARGQRRGRTTGRMAS